MSFTDGAVRGYARGGYGTCWHLITTEAPLDKMGRAARRATRSPEPGYVSMCGTFVQIRSQLAVDPIRCDELLSLPLCPRCRATSLRRRSAIMRTVVTVRAWHAAGADLLAILARVATYPGSESALQEGPMPEMMPPPLTGSATEHTEPARLLDDDEVEALEAQQEEEVQREKAARAAR